MAKAVESKKNRNTDATAGAVVGGVTRPGPLARFQLGNKQLAIVGVGLVLAMAGAMLFYSLQRNDTGTDKDKQNYTKSISDAQTLSKKGDAEAAATALREYSKNAEDPYQKAYAQSLEGVVYERDGQYEKARTAYLAGKDLPAAEGGLASNEGLARVESALGNKDASIAYWRKCIQLKNSLPDDPLKDEDVQTYKGYIRALGGAV